MAKIIGKHVLYANYVVPNMLILTNWLGNYGSSANKVMRFQTNLAQIGTGMTYSDDAANATSVTINTTGRYQISIEMSFSTTNVNYVGLTLNATGIDLTTASYNLSYPKLRVMNHAGSTNQECTLAWTDDFIVGDVLRLQNDGTFGAVFAATMVRWKIEQIG